MQERIILILLKRSLHYVGYKQEIKMQSPWTPTTPPSKTIPTTVFSLTRQLFRTKFNYPTTPYKSIGRPCLVSCYQQALNEVKRVPISDEDNQAAITSLQSEKEDLKNSSLRATARRRLKEIEAELMQRRGVK